MCIRDRSRGEEEEEKQGIAFSNMLEAYEALRSEEKGSRAKTTKEGFLYHLLTFLQKQGLIDYVEEDEMIKTTKKLDLSLIHIFHAFPFPFAMPAADTTHGIPPG